MQDMGQGRAPFTSGVLKRACAGLNPALRASKGCSAKNSAPDTFTYRRVNWFTHWRRNGRVSIHIQYTKMTSILYRASSVL
jgi:hypothetical protein